MVGQYEPPEDEATGEQTMVIHDARLEQKFAQVPYEVVFMRGLSRDAKHTYTVLLSYAWKHNKCFPGMLTLCADIEASEPIARRFLRELQDFRLIRIERRGLQRTNLYHLLPVAQAGAPPTLTVVPRRTMSPERKTRFNQERKTRFSPERNAGAAQERSASFTPTKEEEYTEGSIPREKNTTAHAVVGDVTTPTHAGVGADAPRPTAQKQTRPPKAAPAPAAPTPPSETRLLAEAWMKANEVDGALVGGETHKKYNKWAALQLEKRDRETVTCFLRWAFSKRRHEDEQYDIVPRMVDERIGQWIAAGQPERYTPRPDKSAAPKRFVPSMIVPRPKTKEELALDAEFARDDAARAAAQATPAGGIS